MPDSYDREGLIDRATDAINAGRSDRALEIAEEIRRGEGPSADEALIRGIALSSLGRAAEASDAFAEATRRAPTSHKARFNAAVHEFNAGNVEGAKALAAEAQGLDPEHIPTRQLAEKIAAYAAPAPEGAEPPAVVPESATVYPRPEEEESLPWIGKLGSKWPSLAIAIAMVSFLAFVAITAISIRFIGALPPNAGPTEGFNAGIAASRALQKDAAYTTASLVSTVAGILGILWTLLDLVRRKGNFMWLVGVVPLSCLSLGWIILPLYLFVGRKTPG